MTDQLEFGNLDIVKEGYLFVKRPPGYKWNRFKVSSVTLFDNIVLFVANIFATFSDNVLICYGEKILS